MESVIRYSNLIGDLMLFQTAGGNQKKLEGKENKNKQIEKREWGRSRFVKGNTLLTVTIQGKEEAKGFSVSGLLLLLLYFSHIYPSSLLFCNLFLSMFSFLW